MTQFLPPNLLALFAPRDPIPFLAPADKLPYEKKTAGYQGIADFTHLFEDPKDTPPPTRVETRDERLERKRREKAEQVAYKLEQDIALWDPHGIPNGTTDPFKTLFIARINFDSSESKLRREFEIYGPVRKIGLIHDNRTGKPRGYAFIEYEHERDMHSAYKHADGKKIDGRRVLVDVERARTVKGWLPRRLGGGLGGTRRGGPDVNIKHSGREEYDRSGGSFRERAERPVPASAGGERERRRSRSRERENKRDGERSDRRRRSRSRDRKRRRSRSKSREGRGERRHRSRSRDRDRKRDRRDREKRDRNRVEGEMGEVRIKEEPVDDYPEYEAPNYDYGYEGVKTEDEKNPNGILPPPPPPPDGDGGNQAYRAENGEIDY